MKKSIIVLMAFLFVVLLSCKEKVVHTAHQEESPKYRFSEFLKSIKTFPYEATTDKRKRVISGFSKLTMGMNKKNVNEILGEPDAESFSYDTTKVKTYKGSSWGYYLRRYESEYADANYDQVVFIYFDPDDKLYWAKPGNIDLLQSKGGPGLSKEKTCRLWLTGISDFEIPRNRPGQHSSTVGRLMMCIMINNKVSKKV